jgi:hypothetical protein
MKGERKWHVDVELFANYVTYKVLLGNFHGDFLEAIC